MERGDIKHQEMNDSIRKEYMQRLKAILKSKLNAGNMIKAINTCVVPVIRYSTVIIEWMKAELRSTDQKTRKHMTIYKALHPRANTDRLYITRKEGGRGLLSIEDCVNIESRALGQHLETSEDKWLKSAWEEGLIKLLRGELKKETEGIITAAQDQALRTRYVQRTIDRNNISPTCKKCNTKKETINHIASECPVLAQNQYKKRQDSVAKALYWNLCKKHQLPCSSKWYEHQPEGVIENDQAKIL
ncbi:uncharacterized protein [Palaemon carinicauda]|uniref:uncharacterized protein n=1 Tax=Palaemon carinicauda TaxID=392227 RepID=UPI0035B5C43E